MFVVYFYYYFFHFLQEHNFPNIIKAIVTFLYVFMAGYRLTPQGLGRFEKMFGGFFVPQTLTLSSEYPVLPLVRFMLFLMK